MQYIFSDKFFIPFCVCELCAAGIALFLKKLSYPLIFVYAKQTLIKYHPISMSYGMVFGIIFWYWLDGCTSMTVTLCFRSKKVGRLSFPHRNLHLCNYNRLFLWFCQSQTSVGFPCSVHCVPKQRSRLFFSLPNSHPVCKTKRLSLIDILNSKTD